ncbi:MAG TPA: hypothetical protein VMZ31_19070 [Phycisphaerae bacterium]|nr:hypothetical protein [Phycisphaerae bacterium]
MSHEFMGLSLDVALPVAGRVDDLISRLSLGEKVGQMLHEAPAIRRVGLPEYNWWNECLHGVTIQTWRLPLNGRNAYHGGCVLGGLVGGVARRGF